MKFPISSRLFIRLASSFAMLASVCELQAQVGSNNPTGPSGWFNGNVTTGCNYDPYTGDATRSVTDITVAGAVGTYGLSFSRVSYSRSGTGYWFGMPGQWRHSYEWLMDDSLETTSTMPPTSYSVQLPDGRYEIFTSSPNDPVYYRAAPGTRERFQPLNTNTMLAYLILADGGKVEFGATLNSVYDYEMHRWYYWYSYVAQAIIDPYGLRTTLTYANGYLITITEPAGRYITINWGTQYGSTVITSVQGSDGRTVQYNYAQAAFSPGTRLYVYLSGVSYYSDASVGAALTRTKRQIFRITTALRCSPRATTRCTAGR